MTWRPILTGSDADQAREAVFSIGEDLADPGAVPATLCEGSAGVALFHAYLHLGYSRAQDRERALRHLAAAGLATRKGPMVAGLYDGYVGIAWAAAHISSLLPGRPFEDAAVGAERAVAKIVSRPDPQEEFDLMSGLVGLGILSLERLPDPLSRETLESIVDRLAELAVTTGGGICFPASPSQATMIRRHSAGSTALLLLPGMAHGVAGVVAFLGAVCALLPGQTLARHLLDGAVRWLLERERKSVLPPRFPYWFTFDGGIGPESRLGWCHGDPGIAAGLLVSARCVGERDWEREAVRIAQAGAEAGPERAGVVDPSLCHGAAGLAHIFNRFYQATGIDSLAEASRLWFRRALSMRRKGDGVGGFVCYLPTPGNGNDWAASPGFLIGAAGIGLALLAAVGTVEPEWDRVLLLSVPPGSRRGQNSASAGCS